MPANYRKRLTINPQSRFAAAQFPSARQVDDRRIVHVQEAHRALDQRPIQRRDPVICQKFPQGDPLEDRRKRPQRPEMQAALGIEDVSLRERPRFERFGVIGTSDTADQSSHGIAAGNFRQQGNGLVAQAVAHGDGLRVAGVVPPFQFSGDEPANKFPATDLQQWPVQLQFRAGLRNEVLSPAHALESVRTAQEIPQDGLSLIVGVVSEDDSRAAVLFRACGEKRVPRMAGGGFHGLRAFVHEGRDIRMAAFAGKAEFPRKALHEFCIFRGRPPAQAVIEVTDNEIGKSLRYQQVQ